MLVRRKLIRKTAIELLNANKVKKPPVPIELIATRLGATIIEEPAEDELSGFLLRDRRKNKIIIGVNENHHKNRRRFTIAHECGHLLLHDGEELHVDKRWSGYEVKMRDTQSSTGTSIDEMEANLFAAELLMPIHLLDIDLAKYLPLSIDDEDQIGEIAAKYEVSAQALTLRLTYLGCIPQ